MVSIEDIERMESEEDIDGLINHGLHDPDPDIRFQSAISILNIDDLSFIDFLIGVLQSDDSHISRTIAAEALSNIAKILDEKDNLIMKQVMAKSVEPLIRALNDDSYEVRGLSCCALGNIGDLRAVEPLIISLEDPDFIVRRNSVDALGKIGDSRAVGPLIKTLDDDSFIGRGNSAYALGIIGDPRAIEPLIKSLGDYNEEVQDITALVLGKMGSIAVEQLINALENPNKDIQAYAAIILGNIGDLRAVKPLIKVLESPPVYSVDPHPNDPEWDVQASAAISLGNIRDAQVIEPLKRALISPNKTLSLRATEALKQMGIDGESLIKKYQMTKEKESDMNTAQKFENTPKQMVKIKSRKEYQIEILAMEKKMSSLTRQNLNNLSELEAKFKKTKLSNADVKDYATKRKRYLISYRNSLKDVYSIFDRISPPPGNYEKVKILFLSYIEFLLKSVDFEIDSLDAIVNNKLRESELLRKESDRLTHKSRETFDLAHDMAMKLARL